MPKFRVVKGHDAFVYYETTVEADSPEDARLIAAAWTYDGPWEPTGEVTEYDDYEILTERTEELEGEG